MYRLLLQLPAATYYVKPTYKTSQLAIHSLSKPTGILINRANMSSSSREAKKELRSQMKEKLSSLPEQEVMAQSRIAQDLVLASPQYKSAKRIGIYLSMPHGEAQTDSLVVDAVFYGKKVFVPYIYSVGVEKPKRKVMDMMHIESLEEYGELERDSWGIPKLKREGIENRENAMGWRGLSFRPDGEIAERSGNADAEGGLDLIIVPAVAFDKDLNRMGHGAGFYDKYLTQHFGDAQRKRPYLREYCRSAHHEPLLTASRSRTMPGGANRARRETRNGAVGLES